MQEVPRNFRTRTNGLRLTRMNGLRLTHTTWRAQADDLGRMNGLREWLASHPDDLARTCG